MGTKTNKAFSDKFTEVVSKIAGNKLLLTLRDSFVLVASLTLLAGFMVMISSVFLDPNGIIFGTDGLNLGGMIFGSNKEFLNSGFAGGLIKAQEVCGAFTKGSMSINALLVVVIFANTLSKRYFRKN